MLFYKQLNLVGIIKNYHSYELNELSNKSLQACTIICKIPKNSHRQQWLTYALNRLNGAFCGRTRSHTSGSKFASS